MRKRFLSMLVLLAAVATGAMAQNYKVSVKEGTEDATSWTITPDKAKYGQDVKLKYNGRLKVKKVTATTDAAPANQQ